MKKYTIVHYIAVLYASIIFCSIGYAMEALKPQGFLGSLYAQSWLLAKPQLILYALGNNLFESTNPEHKTLLQNALLECIKNQNSDELSTILRTLLEKFPKKYFCLIKTAHKIHNFATNQQTVECTRTNQALVSQYKGLADLSEKITNVHSCIQEIIVAVEQRQDLQKSTFKSFCDKYKKQQAITLLVHQVSRYDDSNDIISNCTDNDEDGNLLPLEHFDDKYMKTKIDQNRFNQLSNQLIQIHNLLKITQENVIQLQALCTIEQ